MVVFNYNPISAVNYDNPLKSKDRESSDSDVSSYESRDSTPDIQNGEAKGSFSQLFEHSSSNSNDDDDEDEIDNIWADKSPEYPPATPTFIKSQFNADMSSNSMLEIAGITAKAAVAPVYFNPEQLARLELHKRSSRCSSCSSDEDDEAEGDNLKRNRKSGSKGGDLISKSTSITDTTTLQAAEGSTIPQDNSELNQDNTMSNSDPPESQFSRSSVGGSKFLSNCHPYNPDEYDGLEFESRFESGNLAKAVRITPTYYELYLRPDLYTSRSKQWFYFRVRNTRKNIIYRFSIVNLVKSDSLYNDGMRPLMYSAINAKELEEGWRRCGDNICYYRNDDENATEEEEDNSSYTLTFNIEFPHDKDTVYFAHSYPYTYSDLQDYLMAIQKNPVKSKFCKLRLLCRSLAGNNVYYLTVTAPTTDEEAMKRKKSIVVSARVHPSETPSSWMMKGLMDFITGDSTVAKRLRHKFIFKLIPMLNPDGVIVGNTRNSLTGKDLNRQYRTVIRETYPSIWYTKAMIKRLIDECGVAMYCDMHAHSRKHNIFVYGCENKRNPEKKLTEQVFPLMMHKNVADKFSFEGCKFKIQRSKEGTGRIVMWLLGITNSYTIEASFGGSSLSSRKNTHFNTLDYEHIGRAFCETLLDYCDENPIKVKKQVKLLKQVKKIRKHEKREREALKIKKLSEQERLRLKIIERLLKEGSSADEPLNIPLTDYSSDEGHTSSSSDNDVKSCLNFSDLEGPCCQVLKAPPCSPEISNELRKFKYKRMRKVMHELDRIYFQPLMKRKLRILLKTKRLKHRREKRSLRASNQLKVVEKTDDDTDSEIASKELANNNVETNMAMANAKEYSKQMTCETAAAIADVLAQIYNEGSLEKITPPQHTTKKSSGRSKSKKKKRKSQQVESLHTTKTNQRIRVSRKMRLWLERRKIIIYRQQNKVNRKLKMRSKSSHGHRKKVDIQRVLLDLPTTDPGSDIHFSTDEELFVEGATSSTDISFSNLPRTRRSLLQSDLQRRYIEEIGDGTNSLKCMPPELIVTSPTKNISIKGNGTLSFRPVAKPKTAPDKGPTIDFPLIVEAARRTNSWNNVNVNSAKGASKTSIPNPYQFHSSLDSKTKEDLQFMLSLKKKVWTGTQPDSTNRLDSNRPLSWGMPPLAAQTKKERNQANIFQTKRDETEALFTACSQKLMAWQQNNMTQGKNKMTVNLMTPETKTEDQQFRFLRQVASGKKVHKSQSNYNQKLETIDEKIRKRKNPPTKISDSTDLVTHLAKRKSQNIVNKNRHIKGIISSSSIQAVTNKFKTGGLVATAVQSTAKKKIKKVRLNPSIYMMKDAQVAVNKETKTPQTETGAISKEDNNKINIETALHTDHFVRKVKTKLKKKKSSNSGNTLPPMANSVSDMSQTGTGTPSIIGAGVIKKNYIQ